MNSERVIEEKPPRRARPDDWFEDVTRQSGVDFTYQSGRKGGRLTILETVGGGVAMIDYDRDGDLDLFFPGGGTIAQPGVTIKGLPPALFRNDGDWKFTDVTKQARLDQPGDYSHGCTVGDFNRDGWPDLFVTCFGRSRLFQNEQGRFRDVTDDCGLLVDGWSTAAAWADVDRDGWPDLFVVGYLDWKPQLHEVCGDAQDGRQDVCPPQRFPPAQDRLFRNRGDGTFEEITESAGLRADGKGLGVVAGDFDENGWIDFYVANDVVANHLYLGGPGGKYEETGEQAGVARNEFGAPEGSMGVDFGDFNGDGRGDLWVTNFEMEDNSLYRSTGDGFYVHATVTAGLGGSSRPYVGFGTGLADFDGDGWLDLFVVNGHVLYSSGQSPYRQPSALYRNLDGRRFVDVTEKAGPWFSVPHAARGAAVGDLDNDGALDLVIVQQDEPVVLLRNRLTPKNWVRLQLVGQACDPRAVGAVVSMPYRGRELVRWVCGGAGYLSHFDQRLLFPADESSSVEVSVRWPDGGREVFRDIRLNETNVLVQSAGEPADDSQ